MLAGFLRREPYSPGRGGLRQAPGGRRLCARAAAARAIWLPSLKRMFAAAERG